MYWMFPYILDLDLYGISLRHEIFLYKGFPFIRNICVPRLEAVNSLPGQGGRGRRV